MDYNRIVIMDQLIIISLLFILNIIVWHRTRRK